MVEDVGDLLSKAGLDEFSDNFKQQGFTTGESLMILTMQDYPKFGIVHTEDKRKLFQIIQQQKQVKNKDVGGSSRMSSVIARLTSSEKKSKEKKSAPSEPTPPNSMYFNRATFLRRSFNKTKGSDSEGSLQRSTRQNMSTRDRSRCASSQPALGKKTSMSASAENINELKDSSSSSAKGNNLRKSASGRTDIYAGRSEHSAPAMRTRSKTTSIITNSVNRSKSSGNCKSSDKIKVCVRKRPLNRKEKTRNETDVVDMLNSNQCEVSETKTSVDCTKFVQKHCYVFDAVFGESTDNETVYQNTAKPLVDWVFQGNKATCFAYGQTGSGKTYTMVGAKSVPGLVMLAARDIFSTIQTQRLGDDLRVFVSFYEIYCGQLFDLINKRKRLNALENAKKAICIVGLTEKQVHSQSDVIELVRQGGVRRSSGSTSVNAESSRSHAILQIELKNKNDKCRGKFSFIDLAGSERAADVSDTNKQTRMEGAEINTSLLALKECIRALDQESKHTPFRQSKLTQVLRDSFVGNSKTCMIASISPNISSCEDTLNTLRYADRVKELGREDIPSQSPSPRLTNGNRENNQNIETDSSSQPVNQDSGTNHDNKTTHENRANHDIRTSLDNGNNHDNKSNHDNRSSHDNYGNGSEVNGTHLSVNDSFLLDTSDLASDLPSDISLVSRTDESDVSYISANSDQVAADGRDDEHNRSTSSTGPSSAGTDSSQKARTSQQSRQKSPKQRSPRAEKDEEEGSPGPPPCYDSSTVYVYPKPPATAPPRYEQSPSSSEPSGSAWMERSRTMASAPRSRMLISENKMKKAQDDLVASHQIHISQVTNLCSIEAELLQNFTDGHLEFTEYMKKLETILESKNKCVESLRAQVACYSLRATY